MNEVYEKISGFSLGERLDFLISNSSGFVIVSFILIVLLLGIIAGIFIANSSSLREKFKLYDNEYWAIFFVFVGVISIILLVTLLTLTSRVSTEVSEESIENNITAKYDFSDAVLWDTVNEEQGVYLVNVFDEKSLKRELREFWFDAETHEPHMAELDSEGVDKILSKIDELSKED